MSSIYKNGTVYGTTEADKITTHVAGTTEVTVQQALQNLTGNLAPVEVRTSEDGASYVTAQASRSYATGDYLTIQGILYRVTNSINANGSISTANNIEAVSLTRAATTATNGLMSAADKTKLNGIATGANVNTNSITGIKGNAQQNYRSAGNINLTPANIGALSLSGGTVTGFTYITNNFQVGRPSSNTDSNNSTRMIHLGNGKTNEQGGSDNGELRIYGDTGKYAALKASSGLTSDRSFQLPNKSGYLATTDLASTQANGLMSSTDKTRVNSMFSKLENAFCWKKIETIAPGNYITVTFPAGFQGLILCTSASKTNDALWGLIGVLVNNSSTRYYYKITPGLSKLSITDGSETRQIKFANETQNTDANLFIIGANSDFTSVYKPS